MSVINTAFSATEIFPIKGTSSNDTIEVRDTNGKIVEVYINGKIVNYEWEKYLKDRLIKAGAGDDKITISNKYGFIIYGEDGEDVIQGSNDYDIILGGPGGDEIKGGDGNDWIKEW